MKNLPFSIALLTVGLALGATGCAAAGSLPMLGWLCAALALGVAACTTSREPSITFQNDGSVGTNDGGAEGGHWGACCVDGVITTCHCPAGLVCNYGLFEVCGDGTCTWEGFDCPGDGGVTEPEGTWEPCCQDGVITTCLCPAGAACNYGQYTDCGDDVCVSPVDTCPADS